MNSSPSVRNFVAAVIWMCAFVFPGVTDLSSLQEKGRPAPQDTLKALPFGAEVEQEKKENDRKLAQEEIDRVLAGTRGFAADKLSVFSAAEQSRIMEQIAEYAGVPYEVGGKSKDGVDCASFVALVYKNAVGLELPESSVDQFYFCRAVSRSEAHFGDLVFFNTTGRRGSHVGIYLSNQLFAHASVSMGVTISTLESSYYRDRFEGPRRLPKE